MKRLAIVEYIRSAGGVERVLRGLARALLELPEAADWDVTLLLSHFDSAHHRCDWPAELSGPRLRVEWLGDDSAAARWLDPMAHAQGIARIPFTRTAGLVGARLARRLGPRSWRAWLGDPHALLARVSRRFDLMYLHFPFGIVAPPLDCAVVTTPADFNYKHFLGTRSLLRRWQERSARSWLARSERLLLSTAAVQEELARFYPEYLDKAEVVHLGLDVVGPPPAPEVVERVRQERRLPPEFALVTGWVAPHKNQLAMVDAAVELKRRGRRLPVVFAGPNAGHLGDPPTPGYLGPYVEQVRARLRQGGLRAGRDYHVLGYVSDQEIQALYRLATVFVVPSLYEGFGLSGLEAMLAGCPVILSEIPPLLEQLRLLGDVAPTFDPRDAGALADRLVRVLDHREEAATRARAAAARVPQVFDWRNTARAYLRAFDEVLAARAARSG